MNKMITCSERSIAENTLTIQYIMDKIIRVCVLHHEVSCAAIVVYQDRMHDSITAYELHNHNFFRKQASEQTTTHLSKRPRRKLYFRNIYVLALFYCVIVFEKNMCEF